MDGLAFRAMTSDYLAHLRADSARFAAVLAGTDPAAPVPSCPDWSAADLVAHLTEVQTFWGTIVAERLTAPPAEPASAADAGAPADLGELLAGFRGASERLAAALAAATPATPVWTWHDTDHTVGFVLRRQAHEALVHRLDAEAAAGVAFDPVDPDLAGDGVDEVLDVMYGGAPPWATATVDGPVGLLRTTDTGRQWWVQVGRFDGVGPESGNEYRDQPMLALLPEGRPTFTVSAPAADLDAWLWNRPTTGPVSVDGDASRFIAVLREGIQ
jgi:uncharacterized protein (TIGR03083 family)